MSIAAPVHSQAVRHDLIDRMTDQKRPRVLLASSDASMGPMPAPTLIFECGRVVVTTPTVMHTEGRASSAMVRVDQQPAFKVTVTGIARDRGALDASSSRALREAVQLAARTVAMRLTTSTGDRDLEFPMSGDGGRAAFLLAAETLGIDRATAMVAYQNLDTMNGLGAAGRNPDYAALMKALAVDMRTQGRPRTAAELMPDVVEAVRRNLAAREINAAGQVLWGPNWRALMPLIEKGGAGYRQLIGPVAGQIQWLERECRPRS